MLTLKKHKLHKFNMISRKSDLTGNINTMELPLSFVDINRINNNSNIDLRSEFQFLNFSERQFLLTGITLDEDAHNRKLNNQQENK
jgi:hypothetical protein